ncbi:MAG: Na+/H+ antiporter NhaC [Tissierellia bacterium]|nr:Na+/H+ antiporter NhaC [Tissierellia bacterium]
MESNIRQAHLWEAILVFALLIIIMFVGINTFEVDPHMPMFVGVIIAALVALRIGYKWKAIEGFMINGITQALQSVVILAIIGILIGVWIVSGVVPTMISYGLRILSPRIFLPAALIITSITSLATGTSWGTMGTMGIALMGIATGLGIPAPITAGAVISGAYFGDKMSPLSDTTNLAPAMAGTDVFTHVKMMMLPTMITYAISLVFFFIMGAGYGGGASDLSVITAIQEGLHAQFTIHPLLLLPPVLVIVLIAKKMPAMPGITIGILSAAILAPLFQSANLGDLLAAGYTGYVSNTGMEALDDLLTSGGLEGMMYSISLTIIAMMFGGIAENIGLLTVLLNVILKRVKTAGGIVTATVLSSIFSNATMPEQYISLVVPGRMFNQAYTEKNLHPKTLSAALEGGGTVTSALVPWNTCGAFIRDTLGIKTIQYAPFAIFNWLMPIMTIVLAYVGPAVAYMTEEEKAQKIAEGHVD